MIELIKKAIYTGVGFAVLTKEKAEELVKELAQQAQFSELFDDRERKFAGFVPLHDVGSDLALGEFAHHFLQLQLLIRELEIQGPPPRAPERGSPYCFAAQRETSGYNTTRLRAAVKCVGSQTY